MRIKDSPVRGPPEAKSQIIRGSGLESWCWLGLFFYLPPVQWCKTVFNVATGRFESMFLVKNFAYDGIRILDLRPDNELKLGLLCS